MWLFKAWVSTRKLSFLADSEGQISACRGCAKKWTKRGEDVLYVTVP